MAPALPRSKPDLLLKMPKRKADQWKVLDEIAIPNTPWCDFEPLNLIIGQGYPTPEVGVRLTQISLMLRFFGPIDLLRNIFLVGVECGMNGLFGCLFVCLFGWLVVCLFVFLFVCLFVCLFVYLFVCMFVFFPDH